MSESIFTTQADVPNRPTNYSDGPITVGTVFKSSVNGTIDAIRYFAPDNGQVGRKGALYQVVDDTHGIQLGPTIDVVTALDTVWNTSNFPTPIDIVADQLYVVTVYYPTIYVATGGFFTGSGAGSSGISNGHLFSPPSGTSGIGNGKFLAASGGPSYPTDTFNGGNYFIDVVFTPSAVEPSFDPHKASQFLMFF